MSESSVNPNSSVNADPIIHTPIISRPTLPILSMYPELMKKAEAMYAARKSPIYIFPTTVELDAISQFDHRLGIQTQGTSGWTSFAILYYENFRQTYPSIHCLLDWEALFKPVKDEKLNPNNIPLHLLDLDGPATWNFCSYISGDCVKAFILSKVRQQQAAAAASSETEAESDIQTEDMSEVEDLSASKKGKKKSVKIVEP